MSNLNEALIRWSTEEDGNELIAINNLLEYLGENLYHDYEPASGPALEYYARLKKWVFNISDDASQQNLLRIAQRIFYVGREEFGSLYRTAFNSIVTRWIVDQENISLFDTDWESRIAGGINYSWFCPVTDSMRISQFYHVNNISSTHEYRPDWRSLHRFGDPDKIKSYIKKRKIKYIVLLEDFVGSATQSFDSIKFACGIDDNVKVLFIPLIICKSGIKRIMDGTSEFDHFTMTPVMVLEDSCFVTKNPIAGEDNRNSDFRNLIQSSVPEYKGQKFGFDETGSLLVMYTNTPNNTLPIIHYEADQVWTPLFNRHHRSKK
ncbi:phosphoribosyltransferase-like protein [Pseudoflavitalea rhizosphaerae]|uniref:phosphoribosyltransferase-like protein n=1 Tax=Pseudoflavitalea rhizosphaerae TaxID=1884793 RepID=UPI000F8EBE67|nr:hypothetical protein [Pseudoflavitalea rhizosphaerae]